MPQKLQIETNSALKQKHKSSDSSCDLYNCWPMDSGGQTCRHTRHNRHSVVILGLSKLSSRDTESPPRSLLAFAPSWTSLSCEGSQAAWARPWHKGTLLPRIKRNWRKVLFRIGLRGGASSKSLSSSLKKKWPWEQSTSTECRGFASAF